MHFAASVIGATSPGRGRAAASINAASANQDGSSSGEHLTATILMPAAVRAWIRPFRKRGELTSRSVRIKTTPQS
jgi:hypothetical protein